MKKFLLGFLSIFFPWVIFLINDFPGKAFLVLAIQASGIGWLPASIWAWHVAFEPKEKPNDTSKNDTNNAGTKTNVVS